MSLALRPHRARSRSRVIRWLARALALGMRLVTLFFVAVSPGMPPPPPPPPPPIVQVQKAKARPFRLRRGGQRA